MGLAAFLSGGKKQNSGLEVTEHSLETQNTITPADIIKQYNHVYEKIRDMLLRKTDAVSINKIKNQPFASVIGMVRALTQSGYVIEDPTGETDVISSNRPMLDDVIAVKGIIRDGRIIESEVLYPDIPITRNTPAPDITLLFLRTKNGFDVTVKHGEESKKTKTKNKITTLLATHNNISASLLFYSGSEIDEYTARTILKRRHFLSINGLFPPNTRAVINSPPHTFCFAGSEPKTGVYKGVIIISLPENHAAEVCLGTGKAVINKTE